MKPKRKLKSSQRNPMKGGPPSSEISAVNYQRRPEPGPKCPISHKPPYLRLVLFLGRFCGDVSPWLRGSLSCMWVCVFSCPALSLWIRSCPYWNGDCSVGSVVKFLSGATVVFLWLFHALPIVSHMSVLFALCIWLCPSRCIDIHIHLSFFLWGVLTCFDHKVCLLI